MHVRLMGCIGDDPLGRWMSEELAPAGLAHELVTVAGQPTGLTVALESPERDRTFLTHLGVNANWGPDMIPQDALDCDNLLLCDYFVAPALQGDAAHGLLATARALGARTFFDTAWDPGGFSTSTRAEVWGLLSSVDVFLPNEAEACALAGLTGDAAPEAARALQAQFRRLGCRQARRPRVPGCWSRRRGARRLRPQRAGRGHDRRRGRLQRGSGPRAERRLRLAGRAGRRHPVRLDAHLAAVQQSPRAPVAAPVPDERSLVTA